MTASPTVRSARLDDIEQFLALWGRLFDEDASGPWRRNARAWFADALTWPDKATFPVIESEGRVVACAIGTLETGVPNPQSPTGRAVRLSNVITSPEHRGRGHGAAVTQAVIRWAQGVGADRVDLSATPDGERLYERLGFVRTSAPRMKLHL